MLAILAVAACPTAASASRLISLDRHDRAHVAHAHFPRDTELPPPPGGAAAAARARAHAAARVRAGATRDALSGMLQSGAIDQATYQSRLDTYNRAVAALGSIRGRSRKELGWVIENTDEMAQAGALIPTRLEPVFLVLSRNTEYWTSSGPLPADGDRIKFYGSLLLFQYYPGEGLQLQALANWGKANGYLNGGVNSAARYLLNELVPLGVLRDGGIVWEYYFHYGGGSPPWTSSISQGTALQALEQAAVKLRTPTYKSIAYQGLRTFQLGPPRGVRKAMGRGRVHYLIYSFAPRYYVLNAFIQALNGLFDAGAPSRGNSAKARSLFAAGDREARRELPRFDTGHWSRYSLSGELSTTSYHILLRDFLRDLCQRTHTSVYCRYARKFTRYLNG